MSTSHRPTFNAAVGANNQGGWAAGGKISQQFSARDLPGHTKLKFRQPGQSTIDELQTRDLKEELEEKEQKANEEKLKESEVYADKFKRLKENKLLLLKGVSAAAESDGREAQLQRISSKFDDADDVDSDESDSSDDSDSDEDEEVELMRELEKIKKEREEERLRKEQMEQEQVEMEQKEEILRGNPLVAGSSDNATVKRRWNEDVVFKNQARNEPELKKRFINDTIRNDFHRRFLNQYMQ